MNFTSLKNKIDKICKKKGIEDYQISYSSSEDASCKISGHTVDSSTVNTDMSFTFSCISEGKRGVYVCNVFDDATLENMVAKAYENTQCIDSEEKFEIFEGSKEYKHLEDNNTPLEKVDKIIEKTKEIQAKNLAKDPRIQESSETSTFAVKSDYKIANSKGLFLEKVLRYEGLYSEVVAKDKEDVTVGVDFKIAPLDEIKNLKAVEKALNRQNATQLETGTYDVVFDTDCVRQILATFCPIFIGKNVYMGLSLLKAGKGEKIANKAVTLIDDPFETTSPVKIHFDTDGVATYCKEIIKDGIQENLVYNLSTAKKAGVTTTGNSSGSEVTFYSLYFKPGEKTKEELLEEVGRGIYISEMKGFHAGANAQTGDFSIDSEGFKIENGKLVQPVKGFTVSGNFYKLLRDIEAFSSDLEFSFPSGLTRFGSAEAYVRNMSIAGK